MTLQKLSKHILAWALTLSAAGVLSSCGNNGCEETRESYLCVQFKASAERNIRSLTAWGLTQKGDSLLMQLGTNQLTDVEFYLKPDATSTQILMHCVVAEYDETLQFDDTLSIYYTHYPYFLDIECGCSMFYQIDSVKVTHSLFKNCTLKNDKITNEENVNVLLQY